MFPIPDDKIKLTQCPIHGNMWGISLWSNNQTLQREFITACREEVNNGVTIFWQAGRVPGMSILYGPFSDYNLFEFWSNDESRILETAMEIADVCGQELFLE
jgi:hypothetical protein